MIANRAISAFTFTFFSCLAACSSTSGDQEIVDHTGAVRSAVVHGEPSDSSQDAVVLLVYYDPSNQGFGQCTGTLLAPRLVLTARHCVGDTDPYAACKADGTPILAGEVRKNHKANTLYVFTGKDRPDFARGKLEPAGRGKTILDDGGKNLCNHDIALVVLEAPITDAPIVPIRLDADVEVGEQITAIGWGVTEKTASPRQRQQRKDIAITNVGPDKSGVGVPPNEFQVGESICSGDSGGPAIAQETGAVVGVVSRGGNDQGGDSKNPAANCVDGKNLYTKVAPFKDVILEAYALAEAEPWLEGGPDPRKRKPKEACTAADDCRSALCLPDPSAGDALTCAEDCSSTETCSVEGEVCVTEGEAKVCRAPAKAPESTGMCSSAKGRFGFGGASLFFGLLALASLRRKRAPRTQ